MYGVDEFAAIINPPHAGILAVGAASLVVNTDRSLTVMTVTLSADHRVLTEPWPPQWLAAFAQLIENPVRMSNGCRTSATSHTCRAGARTVREPSGCTIRQAVDADRLHVGGPLLHEGRINTRVQQVGADRRAVRAGAEDGYAETGHLSLLEYSFTHVRMDPRFMRD